MGTQKKETIDYLQKGAELYKTIKALPIHSILDKMITKALIELYNKRDKKSFNALNKIVNRIHIPKRLKPSTIKNYSAKQLAKHLDRLQDVFWDAEEPAPYRVDFSYSEIRQYDKEDHCYYFGCNLLYKEGVLRAVNNTYRLLGI